MPLGAGESPRSPAGRAPAWPAHRGPAAAGNPPGWRWRRRGREKTEIASISGGSPTALERKIVGSRFSFANRLMPEILRPVAAGGNLVGAGGMGAQAPLRIPDQLLAGQPAHALDEAALDLAEVDGRIQRLADVMQDVDARHLVFAGQRVDHHLAHRRAIGEVVEGMARGGAAVVVDLRRRVVARRRERDPRQIGLP